MPLRSFAAIIVIASIAPIQADDPDRGPLQLTVPPACHAVAGIDFGIWFDNIVLTEMPESYRFVVESDAGSADARRWLLRPTDADVGTKTLRISVRDSSDRILGTTSTELHIAAADANADRELSLLLVGDSLTHATKWPNELARLLSQPGNPKWRMLGTHRPSGAKSGVAHEGYGGWTWQRFNTLFSPTKTESAARTSSPFVFAGEDGKPSLDVNRYLRETAAGSAPDVVVFLLGINDCFGARPDDAKALDAHITGVLKEADTLLAEFHRAAPNAELAVCLTTPPNVREEAFVANYKGNYHRSGWKRIQHRLVQRELAHFAGREKEGIRIIPTNLNLDPVEGYPRDNAVHPNETGYRQIAASVYAWLKCMQIGTKAAP